MKETLEKLWEEYLAEECAYIDTEEERELIKNVAGMYETLKELLTKAQSDAVEEYVEAIYQMEASYVRRAFCKGCEVTASVLLEAGAFEKE